MTTWLDRPHCWGEIERCSSPATSSLKSLSLIHSKPLNSAKIQRTLQRSSSIRPQFALNPQESSSGQYNLVRGGGSPSNCQNISTVKIPPWLGPSNVWQYVTLYHAGTEQCRSYTECITWVWSRRNDTLWHCVRGSVARGEWRTMEDIPRLRHPLPSHLLPALTLQICSTCCCTWSSSSGSSSNQSPHGGWRVDGLTEDERKPMFKIFHALLPSQTISRPCRADYAALAANARQSGRAMTI